MRFPLRHNIIRASSLHNTFGEVRHYPDGRTKCHQGWDFSASIGTFFFSVADGTVTSISTQGDYGTQLLIDIGDSRWAFYAHLGRIDVAVGAKVKEGQLLGLTGNSGNAVSLHDSEDHLHFEARTQPHPGKGLGGRISPDEWFKKCPLKIAVDVP